MVAFLAEILPAALGLHEAGVFASHLLALLPLAYALAAHAAVEDALAAHAAVEDALAGQP